MRIQVTNHYIGADTQGRMIYPGEYEAGDPLLYGREADLVAIGYAVWLPEAPTEEPAPTATPPTKGKQKGKP
jgi:hypothetical protein